MQSEDANPIRWLSESNKTLCPSPPLKKEVVEK